MRLINKYETSMGANDTIAGSRKGVGVPQRLGKKSIFKWAQKRGWSTKGQQEEKPECYALQKSWLLSRVLKFK